MTSSMPADFRTYQEMDAVYQKLHKQGIVDEPYIVRRLTGNQLLLFFGCRHSNDINDPQVEQIKSQWSKFVANKNYSKVVFCEGGVRPREKTVKASIGRYSEPGLLTWLAYKDSIKIVSPEPDETKEIIYLQDQGFSNSDIMTYYFGRQMYQWLKRDHINYSDWKAYAIPHIDSYARLLPFAGEEITLDKVLSMFSVVTGYKFSLSNEKMLYNITDPTSNQVSAASGAFRDISLFNAISNSWHRGEDVFSLYGSGHAIVLEQALVKLTS